LEYDESKKLLKERLLLNVDTYPYTFYISYPDTLIIGGPDGCYSYLFSKEGVSPVGRLNVCNSKTWMFRGGDDTLRVLVPTGRRVEIFKLRRMRFYHDTTLLYDYPVVGCWIYDTLTCVVDTGPFRGGSDAQLLDAEEDIVLITYPRGIRLLKGGKTFLTLRTPARPLATSYSHGLLHVALGSSGVLTVDARTGAHTIYEGITAVNLYSSLFRFVVIVEDMDGCLYVFRPVFRPPSIAPVSKARTTYCRGTG